MNTALHRSKVSKWFKWASGDREGYSWHRLRRDSRTMGHLGGVHTHLNFLSHFSVFLLFSCARASLLWVLYKSKLPKCEWSLRNMSWRLWDSLQRRNTIITISWLIEYGELPLSLGSSSAFWPLVLCLLWIQSLILGDFPHPVLKQNQGTSGVMDWAYSLAEENSVSPCLLFDEWSIPERCLIFCYLMREAWSKVEQLSLNSSAQCLLDV